MAVNLYKITVGNDNWYYTSGEFDVIAGLITYTAMPLKRTDMSMDINQTEVTITMPADLAPFNWFKYSAPLLPFIVEIIGYPSLSTVFTGKVVSVSFDAATNIAKAKLGSTKALENSTCPSRTFGVTCSYELFGDSCGVDSNLYKYSKDITSITQNNNELTVVGIGTNGDYYYNGGWLQASTGETQYISKQVGDVVTMLGGIVTFSDATYIDFYPGCDKQHTTCLSKFNNIQRFGGFPTIPLINPYTEPISGTTSSGSGGFPH